MVLRLITIKKEQRGYRSYSRICKLSGHEGEPRGRLAKSHSFKRKLAFPDLHDIALLQATAGNSPPVDYGTAGSMVILQLVATIRQLANSCVKSAHCQVFEKNVAFATAPYRHLRLEIKAHKSPACVCEIQFSYGAGIWIK